MGFGKLHYRGVNSIEPIRRLKKSNRTMRNNDKRLIVAGGVEGVGRGYSLCDAVSRVGSLDIVKNDKRTHTASSNIVCICSCLYYTNV